MLVATLTAVLALPGGAHAQIEIESADLGGLQARAIGPATMSGRIAAIDAVPVDPLTIWVGAAGGGVWKSDDGGIAFEPVFDDHTQSIGAVAIDPSDPETVWVGTGESWVRNSVSVGTGVYRTTDGGTSWERKGLADSERIARIVVDPSDGDRVFVCAMGHLWDANEERGVFRTTDGGETWERVLYVDADTGCSDLAMDPHAPTILYAGMWQYRRQPWSFESGGPGSGLYRSLDGGTTWEELAEGLPEGDKGRIAVGVAASQPNVVYAYVEAETSALFRSDDLGENWREVNAEGGMQARPFYFGSIVVDPTDPDRVYKHGYSLTVSTDGGKTSTNAMTQGFRPVVHSDSHALWINPTNPNEVLLGTDGGVYVSYDRGNAWRLVRTLPVSQFYEVGYDMDYPYNVYGGLQDNGSWQGPSRRVRGIRNRDWTNIASGDGFHAVVDPTDPDYVYVESQGGNLLRYRRSTGEQKQIRPHATGERSARPDGTDDPETGNETELRWNWNSPLHAGAAEPGTLYAGSQYLLRSRDRGESWERISPDLTTDDPDKQRQAESGGLTIDNTSAENHTTIYTISASPIDPSVIWVGTDDGNLQMTRDGGASWENLARNASVPSTAAAAAAGASVPPGTWVSHVEASPHAAGTAFVTFDGHRTGDKTPYVLRTDDFGQTWTSLATADITGYAHIVKQDPVNPDLLFLGTEFGLYLSLDGGLNWARYSAEYGGLPPVGVRDLAIHPREHDLILATHGRGIYILDDITPLRHLDAEALASELALLPSRPAVQFVGGGWQEFPGNDVYVGPNPPEAASVVYYQKRRHMFGDLFVEVYDAEGELVATVPGGKRRGLNRVDWQMRLPAPKIPPASTLTSAFSGPLLAEGEYAVRVIKGDSTYEGSVALAPDPRLPHSSEDRRLGQSTAMEMYRLLENLTFIVEATIDLRDQATARADSAEIADDGRSVRRLREFASDLDAFRTDLVASGDGGRLSGEEKLREKLGNLYGAVVNYAGRPTDSQIAAKVDLAKQMEEAVERFDRLIGPELDALNGFLSDRGVDLLVLLTREEWEAGE
jgi:photosystem II stability/assembly factor-like uncharacterized protein